MTFGGIDGCKAGWLLITYKAGKYSWHLLQDINQLSNIIIGSARLFIDMPIGLAAQNHPRTIEKVLRNELGNRSATVFNVPVREAVYESDKQRAKELNIKITGKSLSEQSLNIKPKILELDQFLKQKPKDLELIESHPELCFKYLNGSILQTRKSEKSGVEERLEILKNYDPACLKVYKSIFQNTLRKHIKADDIVDALVLCLSNRLNEYNAPHLLLDANRYDKLHNEIKIGYFAPKKD